MSSDASETVDGRNRKRPAQPSALECNVCLEPFDTAVHRPLSLACGHSLCSKCTAALPSPSPCPVCRKPTPTQDRPVNYTILQLLEKPVQTYACQDCEAKVEVEDAWICREEACAKLVSHPRLVFLVCSRCCVRKHRAHPEQPLSEALAEAGAERKAQLTKLRASLRLWKDTGVEASAALENLKANKAKWGLEKRLESAVKRLEKLETDFLASSKDDAAEAERKLQRFDAGELDAGVVSAEPDLNMAPAKLTERISGSEKLISYIKDSLAKLNSAAEAFVNVLGEVTQGAMEMQIENIDTAGAASVNPRVFFDMSVGGAAVGRVVMELYSDTTPLTAENFRALCTGEKGVGKSGKPLHYKGSAFRVVPNHLCHGGDLSRGGGSGGEGIYGDYFAKENFVRKHTGPGDLAMANLDCQYTCGSQFFITMKKMNGMDGKFVVFGKVIGSMEVLKVIEAVGTQNGGTTKPVLIEDCGQV